MDNINEENDFMKRCSDCGTLKMKTNFYFRNINQNYRKECVQCTNIKQRVYESENREKIAKYKEQYRHQNKDKINDFRKKYEKKRRETDVCYRLIKNPRCRIYHALKGKTKSSSTKDILGIDIDLYKKWIEYQFTPEMNWVNIQIDHVKPICMFDVSDDEQLKEAFNWKNTQPLLKKDHQLKGTKFKFLDYQLQFIKAYQFLRLNEEGYNENLYWWDICQTT